MSSPSDDDSLYPDFPEDGEDRRPQRDVVNVNDPMWTGDYYWSDMRCPNCLTPWKSRHPAYMVKLTCPVCKVSVSVPVKPTLGEGEE